MLSSERTRRTWNVKGPMAVGVIAVFGFITTVGVWGANAQIAGAVLGTGKVEVSSTMTAVQHPIGGVVAEILAESGDAVKKGDVILRLDDSQLRSDLTIVEGDLYELLANESRLEAALDDRKEMRLDPMLLEASQKPTIKAVVRRQERQLAAHYQALDAEARMLDEQIVQVRQQISGVEAELAARVEGRRPIRNELDQLRSLADKGLAKLTSLYSLEKEEFKNEGEIGQLTARVAELKGKISELELKRATLIPNAKKEVSQELNKVRPDRLKNAERRAAILNALTRLEIRAPVSGTLHDSKLLGVRSVVVAASPLMYIVPSDRPFMVGVRVFATDIDQVFVGQAASMKFLAFNRRKLPIVLGRVSKISPDAFKDNITQKFYYDVEVTLDAQELAKLGQHVLVPGMPVEAFIATQSRTPLDYMLKPLLDYFDRSLRDS